MGLEQAIVLGERAVQVAEELAPAAVKLREEFCRAPFSEIFSSPRRLLDVLPEIVNVFQHRQNADELGPLLPKLEKAMSKGHPLSNLKVTRFLGDGSGQFVVATENGAALKISNEPVARAIPDAVFDAPVLGSGQLGANYHYYLQPIGNTEDVTRQHIISVIRKIRSRGFIDDDMWDTGSPRHGQVALIGRKKEPRLIDQKSALPRYGSTWEDGGLVPHAQQRENLSEIKDFLDERGIELKRWSVTRPQDPDLHAPHAYSASAHDQSLADSVMEHLKIIGQAPTLASRWTSREIEIALHSLAIR